MKINHKDYVGMALNTASERALMHNTLQEMVGSDSFLEHILETCEPSTAYETHGLLEKAIARLYRSDVPTFLVTQTAQEVIDNISVTDSFDLSILRQIHKRGGNILLSKGKSFRYEIVDGFIFVSAINYPGWPHSIDGGNTYNDLIHTSWKIVDSVRSPVSLEWRRLIFRTILFIELTDPEFIFVAAGKKFASSPMGFSNSSPTGVTIVKSTWNKFIIRTEGFGVSGHFRAQRHGEKRSEVKLIWIQPFQKHGYVRKPKSEGKNDLAGTAMCENEQKQIG